MVLENECVAMDASEQCAHRTTVPEQSATSDKKNLRVLDRWAQCARSEDARCARMTCARVATHTTLLLYASAKSTQGVREMTISRRDFVTSVAASTALLNSHSSHAAGDL